MLRSISWRILLSIVAGAGAGALAPVAAQIPAAHFARHAEFEDIKISPDGRYYAATVPYKDSTVLVIINRTDMKSGTILNRGENEHVYWFEWANSDRVVFQVRTLFGGLDFPQYYGQIFAADADGRNHIPIFGYKGTQKIGATRLRSNTSELAWGTVIDMLPEDPKKILITSEPWRGTDNAIATLMELNVDNGVTRKLGRLPLRDVGVLTDDKLKARFVAGIVEGYEWSVKHRPGDSDDWVDLPALADMQFFPVGYSDDKRSVYGLARDESTVRGLFTFAVDSEQVAPIVSGLPYDVTRSLEDPRTGELIGVFSFAEKFSYHFIDSDNPLIPIYKSLLKAFPDQRVWITSVTTDGSELIAQVANDRNASDFFLFDTGKKNATYLMSARAWIDPNEMAPVEPIRFTARDGTLIHGYVTYPGNGAGKTGLPMVVLPHGGPHGPRDVWAFDWQAQFLASRGYAVLQPNFRGSGGYGRDFEESGYREWGAKMQDDVTDATRWAIEEGIADAGRICIYGGSYGGYAALMGVAREPDLYQCAIGSAGVYDLTLMYKKGDIKDWIPGEGYLEKVISDDKNFLTERSPITYASQIKVPVMLIHGGRDVRVPVEHAKAMRATMKKAGNEPRWLFFKDEAHGYYDEDNRTRMLTEIESFLAEHIGS